MITDTELEATWQRFLTIVAPKPAPAVRLTLQPHTLRRPRWYRRGVGFTSALTGEVVETYNYCLDCNVRPAQHVKEG